MNRLCRRAQGRAAAPVDCAEDLGKNRTCYLPVRDCAEVQARRPVDLLERACASRTTGVAPELCRIEDADAVCGEHRLPLVQLFAAGEKDGEAFESFRKSYGSPRTVAFIAYGARIAVHRITGEIVVLFSVEAVDTGVVINPNQVRGQCIGGVVQGIGYALQEKMVYNDAGAVVNATLRNYRIPAFADAPETEVYFADTYDKVGPMGAKSVAENTINPVAPAIGNALKAATGVRFTSLPFSEDRIFAALREPEPVAP